MLRMFSAHQGAKILFVTQAGELTLPYNPIFKSSLHFLWKFACATSY